MQHKLFSEGDVVAAIRAYVVHGTFDKAQEACGISRDTIASFKYRDPEFWDKTVESITRELLMGCTNDDKEKMVRIRSKLLTQIEKRLEEGDEKLNVKTGEKVRVEIQAKELSSILAVVSHALGVDKPKETDEEQERLKRREEFRKSAEAAALQQVN